MNPEETAEQARVAAMVGLDEILRAIQTNGLAVVLLVISGFVITFMWRDSRATVKADRDRSDRQHAEDKAFWKELRDEERQGRVRAEERLVSNSESLKEATSAFASALALMERMAEPDAKPTRRS